MKQTILIVFMSLFVSGISLAQELRIKQSFINEILTSQANPSSDSCPILVDTIEDDTYEEVLRFEPELCEHSSSAIKTHSEEQFQNYRTITAFSSANNSLGGFGPAYTEELSASAVTETVNRDFIAWLTGCLLYTSPSPRDS